MKGAIRQEKPLPKYYVLRLALIGVPGVAAGKFTVRHHCFGINWLQSPIHWCDAAGWASSTVTCLTACEVPESKTPCFLGCHRVWQPTVVLALLS
jgi:hypothetical protein